MGPRHGIGGSLGSWNQSDHASDRDFFIRGLYFSEPPSLGIHVEDPQCDGERYFNFSHHVVCLLSMEGNSIFTPVFLYPECPSVSVQ